MSIKRLEQYFEWRPILRKGKTGAWGLYETHGFKNRIGIVKWYGGWRKYVFYFDEPAGYWDSDGLRMVADFCEKATKEHMIQVKHAYS